MTDTTKKQPRKKKEKLVKSKTQISFSSQSVDDQSVTSSSEAMTEHMRKTMNLQKQQIDILNKSVEATTIKKDSKGYDKSKVVFSHREYSGSYDGVEVKDYRRLADHELKELAQVDPYVSAIISTRVSQGAVIGRPSDSKFDKGTRVYEIDPLIDDDFDTKEQFEAERMKRSAQMKTIMKWVMKCGTTDEDTVNAAFLGADPTFKTCTLSEFIAAQIRNLLTFGRCATQIFRNPEGLPIMFRPAPVETILHVSTGEPVHLATKDDQSIQSQEDAKDYNALTEDERPAAYVQRVDGQNINIFTDRDMQIWYFQKQALFDLDGYPLAPLEQAIYMVFTHQQTLNFLRNSFVKGLAAKGILNLKSTDAAGQLSDEDLDQLRREFHNFANRNDNSATTPVIAGPVEVSWVPLMSTPKDMEFLITEEHIIRALCSSMQISPEEMGYGNLSVGQGGLTSSSKEQQLTQGEERGLRMLLDTVFDGINGIIGENFEGFEELYRITYVGVGEDTKDSIVQRQQSELNTTATLSSLYADSEKSDPVPFGGNVPLASAFHANVVRYMKYGEFREHFLGEEGASKKPEYNFIVDPNLNAAYQQLLVQPIQAQQQGAEMQLEAQEQQMQAQEQQMQQGQQMAAAGQALPPGQPGQPPQDPNAQPGQPPEQGQPQVEEPQEKSLADAFKERNLLAKSMSSYFSEWVHAHNKD